MREVDIVISLNASLDSAEGLIEECCEAFGLRQTLKGTLAKYPNCVHWHYQQGKQIGTLEITLWHEQRRLWFKVSDGRQATWIGDVVNPLGQAITRGLENQ